MEMAVSARKNFLRIKPSVFLVDNRPIRNKARRTMRKRTLQGYREAWLRHALAEPDQRRETRAT